MRKKLSGVLVGLTILLFVLPLVAQDKPKTVSFAVIGDSGCGCSEQRAVADRMLQWHSEKPFNIVLMLGDNIYGKDSRRRGGSRHLFEDRFDEYYAPLIKKGVKFHAVLGNHDMETKNGFDVIADRERFNILSSKGYYSFSPEILIDDRPIVKFVGINSMTIDDDPDQVAWLGRTLTEGEPIWKIPFFHHPIYTCPGKHEEEGNVRAEIEDVLVAAGVKITLAGHNHFYARMKPQKGVFHFVSGGGGRTLKTPLPDENTAEAKEANHFVYFEASADKLKFWAVPPSGEPFDSGEILLDSLN
jgi:acid phosphatase